MKITGLCLLLCVTAVIGCRLNPPRAALPQPLTREQAHLLAQKLAAEKVTWPEGRTDFSHGPQPILDGNRWTWHCLQGKGFGDVDVHISFDRDGSNPSVQYNFLDGRNVLSMVGF